MESALYAAVQLPTLGKDNFPQRLDSLESLADAMGFSDYLHKNVEKYPPDLQTKIICLKIKMTNSIPPAFFTQHLHKLPNRSICITLEKINNMKQGFTEYDHNDLRSKALALRAETQEDMKKFTKHDNIRNQMIRSDYPAIDREKTRIEIIIRSLVAGCNSRQVARLLRISK